MLRLSQMSSAETAWRRSVGRNISHALNRFENGELAQCRGYEYRVSRSNHDRADGKVYEVLGRSSSIETESKLGSTGVSSPVLKTSCVFPAVEANLLFFFSMART